MQQVLLAIHLIVVLALIGVVLLQRSEGGLGGLSGGGGGGLGGLMSSRGQANLLTRATAVLGALFFILSIAMAIVSKQGGTQGSILLAPPSSATSSTPLNEGAGNTNQPVQPAAPVEPQVPQAQ